MGGDLKSLKNGSQSNKGQDFACSTARWSAKTAGESHRTSLFIAAVMRRAMLWGKILHSPLAHARMDDIDASDARNLVGVKATNVVAEALWCFGFFWFCRLYYGPRHHRLEGQQLW